VERVSVTVGVPVWTDGRFKSVRAENDLGLESVGASLLRRLLPGVLQTTLQAGYYAFYPYLLMKWEESNESILREDFVPFFRRQEVAYACACRLHDHRIDDLFGIQGSNGAKRGLENSADSIDVSGLSLDYIDERLGGYALFYGRVLEAMRLVRPGASRMVDRVTERGRALAEAFGRAFEDTTYYRQFFEASVVPVDVLREVGDAVCLCSIPGRADHQALLDVFFGATEEDLAWEARRQIRARSLALHLAYHDQRPDDEPGDLTGFRSVLASGTFTNARAFETPYPEERGVWRCYQLRECQTLVLTAFWSWYLQRLQETYPTTHDALCDELVASAEWSSVGLAADLPLRAAREVGAQRIADGRALVDAVTPFRRTPGELMSAWLAGAFLCMLAIDREAYRDAPGMAELRDDGGPGRLSLAHMHEWIGQREGMGVASVLRDLLDMLRLQHLRVATAKLSPTDSRDPFCIAEDNGLLRFVRGDEPFWSGARFGVLNTLLWSLGLLDSPNGEARLTELGTRILREVNEAA
jgi:hypothetical protein